MFPPAPGNLSQSCAVDAHRREGDVQEMPEDHAGCGGEHVTVAILCAARKSVYHELPDVDVYDLDRDARTFPGGMPIVAHPPCRAWSRLAKNMGHVPIQAEIELGLWCCQQLRECGGIMEQPRGSLLFCEAGFPDSDIWITEVHQVWWGYPMRKATWLAFCGIDPRAVAPPLRLHPRGYDRNKCSSMSERQRSATTREFAEWLVALARVATPGGVPIK